MDNPETVGDEGGIPLTTCTESGTVNFEGHLDRNDTPPGDAVTLFDSATCSLNTSAGASVTVALRGGIGQPGGLDVTFSEVVTAGSTTATGSNSGPTPPTGFQVVGLVGETFFYDVNTTATVAGPITVCVRYDDTGLTLAQEVSLQLMQSAGGGFDDTTSSIDTDANIVCGVTSHLSFWAVMLPEPVGGTVLVFSPSTAGHHTPYAALSATLVMLTSLAGLAYIRLNRR